MLNARVGQTLIQPGVLSTDMGPIPQLECIYEILTAIARGYPLQLAEAQQPPADLPELEPATSAPIPRDEDQQHRTCLLTTLNTKVAHKCKALLKSMWKVYEETQKS